MLGKIALCLFASVWKPAVALRGKEVEGISHEVLDEEILTPMVTDDLKKQQEPGVPRSMVELEAVWPFSSKSKERKRQEEAAKAAKVEAFLKNVSALTLAADKHAVVEFRLENPGFNEIFDAACRGNLPVVRGFVRQDEKNLYKKEKIHRRTALHMAAACGQLDVAQWLVSAGAEINAKDFDGATALHWAASNGRLETVPFLVSAGAEINAKDKHGKTPLDEAKGGLDEAKKAGDGTEGHTEMVKFLKHNGGRSGGWFW